ncbi:MAG: hypothetical protein Q9208_000112 [Pyrenodesmia sp. 3 TL-2023]
MDPLDYCYTLPPSIQALCFARPPDSKAAAALTTRSSSFNNNNNNNSLTKRLINLPIALPLPLLLLTAALCLIAACLIYWLARRRGRGGNRYKPFRPEIDDDPTTGLLSFERFKRCRGGKPRILRDARGEIVFTGVGSSAPEVQC